MNLTDIVPNPIECSGPDDPNCPLQDAVDEAIRAGEISDVLVAWLNDYQPCRQLGDELRAEFRDAILEGTTDQ